MAMQTKNCISQSVELTDSRRIESQQSSDVQKLTRVKSVDTCRVCGDGPARMHYGVPTCFGCKGFFRRTLKRPKEYTCRYNGNCVVDRYERNSCRHCRFKRCLEVGMDPKAVRPDRDAAGRSHPLRYRRSQASFTELIAGESADDGDNSTTHGLSNDEWIRKLPVDMRTLLMQIMNIELIVANGDTNSDAKQIYPLPYGSLREILQKPSLLDGKRTEMRYETYRRVRSDEFVAIAHRRLVATIDIINHLCGLMEINNVNDKMVLAKSTYAPLWILCCVAATARSTKNCNILCLCQFGYVPRGLDKPSNKDCGYEEPYYFANRLVDRILDELVEPFRTFNFKEQEIVLMKAIVALNPHFRSLSAEASEQIADFRDRVQETLYNVVRESHPKEVASSRFGNLLLFLPSIMLLGNVMHENLQFIQSFGTQHIDPLLSELLDNIEPIDDHVSSGSDYNTSDEVYPTTSSQLGDISSNSSKSIIRHSTSALSMSSTGTAGTGTSGSSYEYLFNDFSHSCTNQSNENLTAVASNSGDNFHMNCQCDIPQAQARNVNLSETESDPDYNMTLRADNYSEMRNTIVHSIEVDNIENCQRMTSDYYSNSDAQRQNRPNFYIDPINANSISNIPQEYIDQQSLNISTHQQSPCLTYFRYSENVCNSMTDPQHAQKRYSYSMMGQSPSAINYVHSSAATSSQEQHQNDPNFGYNIPSVASMPTQKAIGTRHVFTIEPTKNVFPESKHSFQNSNILTHQQQQPIHGPLINLMGQESSLITAKCINQQDSASNCQLRSSPGNSNTGMNTIDYCSGASSNPMMHRSAYSNSDPLTNTAVSISKSQSYPYMSQE